MDASGDAVGYYNSAASGHPQVFTGFIDVNGTSPSASPLVLQGLSGVTASVINSISQNGTYIGGQYTDANGTHGFVENRTTGAVTNIGVANATSATVTAVNDSGQAAGMATVPAQVFGTQSVAFFYDGSSVTTPSVIPVGSTVTGMNNAGQVVGYNSDGSSGFVYSHASDSITTFKAIDPNGNFASDTYPQAINNSGEIAGSYIGNGTSIGGRHAFTATPQSIAVDAPGTLTLSGLSDGNATAGTPVTATISDPNGAGPGPATYTFIDTRMTTTLQSGASNSYTPPSGLAGDTLQVSAAYTDGQGFADTAQASAGTIQPTPVAPPLPAPSPPPSAPPPAPAPAAPGAPILDPESDAGVSNSDGLTDRATAVFTGAAETGDTVTLYDGGAAVASGTATGGRYSITTYSLVEGANSITATQTANGVTSPMSPATTVTLDTTAPIITAIADSGPGIAVDGSGDLNAGKVVTFTLATSEPVYVIGGTPTLLLNDGGIATFSGGSGTSSLTFSTTVTAGQNTAALSISSLQGNGAAVTDAAGNPLNLQSLGTATRPSGTLAVDTTVPVVSSPSLTVAQGAPATPIGIAAPADNLTASGSLQIVVGTLPTDGIVTLADGKTPVTAGEVLTAAQLQGLEFTPTPSSALTYTVVDGAGNASQGKVVLGIGALNPPTVTIGTPAPVVVDPDITIEGAVDAADAGSLIDVYDGSTLLGTTLSKPDGTWQFQATLSKPSYSLHATATNTAGTVTSAKIALQSIPFGTATKAFAQAIATQIDAADPSTVDVLASGAPSGTYAVPASDVFVVDNLAGPATIDGAAGAPLDLIAGAGNTFVSLQPNPKGAQEDSIAFSGGHNTITASTGYDLAVKGGTDLIFLTGSGSVDAVGDTIVGTGASANISGSNNVVFLQSAGTFIDAGTSDTVVGGPGSSTISGGQDGVYFFQGTTTFIGSQAAAGGSDTIVGGASAQTVFGGTGTNLDVVRDGDLTYVAAPNSTNYTVGTSKGSETLFGAPGSLIEAFSSQSRTSGTVDALVAGAGAETVAAFDGSQADLFAGSGNDLIFAGSGKDVVVAGTGNNTIQGGNGQVSFVFVKGEAGGTETIYNFDSNDRLVFIGYGSAAEKNALANQQTVSGGVEIQLPDGTKIIVEGVSFIPSQDVLLDGYIEGGTIGHLDTGALPGTIRIDPNRATTTTDAAGSFSLGGTPGPIAATGGTDTATGLALTAVLDAPTGSTVITPLTTLVEALVATGETVRDANAAVVAALGITPGTDLTGLDVEAGTKAGDAASTQAFIAGSEALDDLTLIAAAGGSTDLAVSDMAAMAQAGTLGLSDAATVTAIGEAAGLDPAAAAAVASIASATDRALTSQLAAASPYEVFDDVTGSSIVEQGDGVSALQSAGDDAGYAAAAAGIVRGIRAKLAASDLQAAVNQSGPTPPDPTGIGSLVPPTMPSLPSAVGSAFGSGGVAGSPGDAISIDPSVTYSDGVFTLSGTTSSAAGVASVEITADVDGVATDLGAATVKPDGTFDFSDLIGRHTQSLITATETDGEGGTDSAQASYSLAGGLPGAGARQDTSPADDGVITSQTLFQANGRSAVDVEAPAQTVILQSFDIVSNHHQGSTTFVFGEGEGLDVIGGFKVGGTDHDTIELPSSDFKDFADVLRNTGDIQGSAFITDPVTGDAIRLAGVTTADLKAHPKDFAFHA